MTRYVAIPKPKTGDGFWDDRMVPPLGHPQVFVSEPVRTGLLDASGNPICRAPDEIGYFQKDQRKQGK